MTATRKRTAMLGVATLVAALLPAVMITPSAGALAPTPAYYPSGPQTAVDQRALAGWHECWSGTYADTPALDDVLAACAGDYLLLAAGPADSTVFDVVAAAPRDDVLTATAGNTAHDANGVGWYFDESTDWGAWGFAKAGDPIDRRPCDIMGSAREDGPNGDQRLCWHLSPSAGTIEVGWRSGAAVDLNYAPDFRRAIYVPAGDSTPPTVTCSAGPTTLSPPNHKLRPVTTAVTVRDDGSGPAGFRLVAVTANEADRALGDGDMPVDVQAWDVGTADTAGLLRAERAGSGSGRVYVLTYEGSDLAGNTAQCTTTVTVPHDSRR